MFRLPVKNINEMDTKARVGKSEARLGDVPGLVSEGLCGVIAFPNLPEKPK
ncbi:hypothetical protein WH297_14175 [Ochrobactrum vermis]|uniref:Uncharacterized protein n=1 Tax=Ochrobactrum vermis TaxID=1827297 RepID=A0ABU8PF36_9HYPH|nr:hypothetical protein [Ochrobactrum vermis]